MIRPFLIALWWLLPICSSAQKVDDVPRAFESLATEPKIIKITNNIDVPIEGGHLQGVQPVEQEGKRKLLISGSSLTQAYLLQVDLKTGKAEQLISLMEDPYRHAGGMQVSNEFLAVGIEDNHTKTISKVCVYPLQGTKLAEANPSLIIERAGKPERNTAGAAGILSASPGYLVVVGDWDSRNWDFYQCSPQGGSAMQIFSHTVPDDWPAYQSINLIADGKAIYAMGFYGKEQLGMADLILVSKHGQLELIMEKVAEKTFNCKQGVDFNTAAGLQVDEDGKLHVWGTQRDAEKYIVVNKFSQQ